jgi:hypothetical protein
MSGESARRAPLSQTLSQRNGARDQSHHPSTGGPLSIHPAEVLIYALIVGIVSIRVFTEMLPILPRVVNAFDYFAMPLLVMVCLASLAVQRKPVLESWRLIQLLILFLVAWGLSWVVNVNRVHWISGLLLATGLLSPVLFYIATTNLPLSRLFPSRILLILRLLLLCNLGVGSYQAIAGYGSDNPDIVYGTFGVNIDQFAFFLAVMMSYFVALWVYQQRVSGLSMLMLGWTGTLFLVASFQTLWVIFPIALLIVLIRGRTLSSKLIPGIVVASLIMIAGWQFVPAARFDMVAKAQEAIDDFDELGKVELFRNVPSVWSYQPSSVVFGVGPGAFNSRAFRSIAKIPYPGYASGIPVEDVSAAIMEPFYTTDVAERFIIPYFTRGVIRLSGVKTDAPFSNLVSIPVELGLPGAVVMFAIYGLVLRNLDRSLRKSADPRQKTMAAWGMACLLMLLGLAVVDNGLEVTRYTLLAWIPVVLWAIEVKSSQNRSGGATPSSSLVVVPRPRWQRDSGRLMWSQRA